MCVVHLFLDTRAIHSSTSALQKYIFCFFQVWRWLRCIRMWKKKKKTRKMELLASLVRRYLLWHFLRATKCRINNFWFHTHLFFTKTFVKSTFFFVRKKERRKHQTWQIQRIVDHHHNVPVDVVQWYPLKRHHIFLFRICHLGSKSTTSCPVPSLLLATAAEEAAATSFILLIHRDC